MITFSDISNIVVIGDTVTNTTTMTREESESICFPPACPPAAVPSPSDDDHSKGQQQYQCCSQVEQSQGITTNREASATLSQHKRHSQTLGNELHSEWAESLAREAAAIRTGPPSFNLAVRGPSFPARYVRSNDIPPESSEYWSGVSGASWRPIPAHWKRKRKASQAPTPSTTTTTSGEASGEAAGSEAGSDGVTSCDSGNKGVVAA